MNGFKFGIEAEFLLTQKSTWKPLWHQDVSFEQLNGILEGISLKDLPSMQGLELEPPHTKLMPYIVEGYHVPNQDPDAADMKPKGVEIRTPVCTSLDECLKVFEILLSRLQSALSVHDMIPVALSHHPIETKFEGPQNKRRHDYWQWAMEVMTTFGPDINVSLPAELRSEVSLADLEEKINYYAPALSAVTAAAPFAAGKLWEIRGQVGKSFRMYKRSVIAPPIEIHPDEDDRLEFKVFDMPSSTVEFRCQILSFLGLILAPELKGRASKHSRIYDLGQVARHGLDAETTHERLVELLEYAPAALKKWGFDPEPLMLFRERAMNRLTPADEMIGLFKKSGSLAKVLQMRSNFKFEAH